MRKYLIALAALLSIGTAQADLVNNPGLFPSATLTAGDCLQATGPNSIASTGAPCGSGSGGAGNVSGPTSSTIGNIAIWTNGTGTAIADSGIAAASIPFLGANNTWGGINTFEVRPVFNGQTPYDTGNLPAALAPYLLNATASATYLTMVAAQQTYATILGVQSAYLRITDATNTYLAKTDAASTYLTPAVADTRYLRIFNGGAPVLGLGPFSNGISGNSTAPSILAVSGDNTKTIGVYPNATTGLAGVGFPEQALSSVVQAGDAVILSNGSSGSGSTLVVGAGATSVNSPAGIRFATAGGGSIAMGVRPTFAGNPAWDAGNFNPAQYLTVASAAATYTTPAEVNTALAGFLTNANAASTYLTQANAAATYQPIATAATAAQLALKANIANPAFTGGATSPAYTLNSASGTWKPISFNTNGGQRWQIGSNNAGETGSNAGSDFDVFSYSDVGAVVSNPIHITRSTGVVGFSARPTWAGFTPWDSNNFNPASYLPLTGGTVSSLTVGGPLTVTGNSAFSIRPTFAGVAAWDANNLPTPASTVSPALTGTPTAPTAAPLTNSTQLATTAYADKAVAAGFAGAVGLPYDVVIPYQGTVSPPTIPEGTHVLHYLFTRKVTIPVGFTGSAIECIHTSTGTVSLGIVSTGAAGGIGNVTFTAGATKATFATIGGPFVFMPGDVLTISTSGNTPDATLGGIFGTIEGAISQ